MGRAKTALRLARGEKAFSPYHWFLRKWFKTFALVSLKRAANADFECSNQAVLKSAQTMKPYPGETVTHIELTGYEAYRGVPRISSDRTGVHQSL